PWLVLTATSVFRCVAQRDWSDLASSAENGALAASGSPAGTVEGLVGRFSPLGFAGGNSQAGRETSTSTMASAVKPSAALAGITQGERPSSLTGVRGASMS